MKVPIRIAMPPGTKAYRIERRNNSWTLWIHPAPDFNSGTLLRLCDGGRLERVTVYEDGTEDVQLLKE